MTAPATTFLQTLKTHLSGITAANGYAVTVASVQTGRSALAGNTAGPYPALTLTPISERPVDNTPDRFLQRWERTLFLEAALVESANWDDELDTLWDAIRHRLTSWNGIITDWGPVEFAPPEDGGGIALLRCPLVFTYLFTV